MDDCVEFTGRRTPGGYGKVFIRGHEVAAHRLAWTEVNGPIPDGLQVLHPEHLFLGTPSGVNS